MAVSYALSKVIALTGLPTIMCWSLAVTISVQGYERLRARADQAARSRSARRAEDRAAKKEDKKKG